jgi:DNA-binding NtrC family response regulator
MPNPAVLVVDDEPDLCELLSITLQRMDLTRRTANNVAAAGSGANSIQQDGCRQGLGNVLSRLAVPHQETGN